MMDAPKPTMPLSVPAPSPSARTTSQTIDCRSPPRPRQPRASLRRKAEL
jgi:hypothetical protein